MKTENDIAVYIIAGGKSSRMGTEKGLVQLGEHNFIEKILLTAKKISSHIVIVSNNDAFKYLPFLVIEDDVKNQGPLRGIATALKHSQHNKNIVLSCDIPLINENVLLYLQNHHDKFDITVVKHQGSAEPLCGIYNKSCLSKIEELLNNEEFSIYKALANFNTQYLNIDKEEFFSPLLLSNINSPAELEKIIALI